MDLRQLRYFIAIVENGGYARAAERLGVGQSTLTQSILKLEQQLDARMFERGRFGARLTEAGALLLPRARLISAEAQLAQSEVSHSRVATNARVAVGLGKSIASSLMTRVMRRVRTEAPTVSVTVIEGWSPELYQKLQQGEIDFAISAPLPGVPVPQDVKQHAVGSQREAVVIGAVHPLASVARPALADLARQFWLFPPEGNGRIRFLHRVFEEAGVRPPTHFLRSDSIPLGVDMLFSGDIVAHGILDVISSYLPPNSFRELDIPELTFDRPMQITTRRRGRLQPASEQFLRIMREVLAEADSATMNTADGKAADARACHLS